MNTRIIKLILIVALLAGMLSFARPSLAASPAAETCQSPVTVVSGDTLFKIALRCGTSVSALMRANPDIKDRSTIYVGQKIVLPGAILAGTSTTDIYIIKKGDTLNKLAERFKTTVAKLLELNKDITNASRIYEGQRLNIPEGSGGDSGGNPNNPTPTPTPIPAGGSVYTVVRGDTLRSIAYRFGTNVDTLLALNKSITDANKIYVGQKITLPAGTEIYTVVRGDTLRSIATKFNTTVDGLLKLNPTIKDADIIYVGQVLRVK